MSKVSGSCLDVLDQQSTSFPEVNSGSNSMNMCMSKRINFPKHCGGTGMVDSPCIIPMTSNPTLGENVN